MTSENTLRYLLLSPKANTQGLTKAARSIAKRSIPVAIRLATAGIVDTNVIIEEELAGLAGELAEDRIAAYESGKSEIKNFRAELSEVVTEVDKISPRAGAKVIIIIDELDRCRPTHAVELLERIKHLFDAPGVVFILGIDRTQLEHSVKALYGTEFDAAGYLRRFIDFDYRLPEPKEGNYCVHLFETLGINDLFLRRKTSNSRDELGSLKGALTTLFSAARMSLRTQTQTIARLRIVLQTIPPDHYMFGLTLAVLLFLREWNARKYESLLSSELNVEDLLNELENLPGMKNAFAEHHGQLIEATLLAGGRELNLPTPRLAAYGIILKAQTDSPEQRRAENVLRIVEYIGNRFHYGGPGFKSTAERIALTNNFVSYGDDETG